VQLETERKPFDHHRPATGLGRVAENHMQAAEMFQKCCGIFADFSQNKEFLLCFCLVSLVGTRTQNCSLPEGFPSLLPPSQPHKSNLSAGTTLLRTYHHPHSSLYKPRTRVTGFLFWILGL